MTIKILITVFLGTLIQGPAFGADQANGFTPPSVRVSSFKVNGLGGLENAYLTTYYVSGSELLAGDITVFKVFHVGPTQLIEGPSVEVKALDVPYTGIFRPTYLVVVVHAQPKHALNRVRVTPFGARLEGFDSPRFKESNMKVVPTMDTVQFLAREAKKLKKLSKSGSITFNFQD